MGKALLDVIVRLHDPNRAFELRRAIFALVCQSYRPIQIHLMTQRFSDGEIERLTEDLASTLAIDRSVRFRAVNYTLAEPKDARSALLNLGIRKSSGRYLAFLDHDDSIFPEAYCELISELENTNSAIAFGSIAMKDVDVFQDALMVRTRRAPFAGKNLLDLMEDNFCPIHSFVIDRNDVAGKDLVFNESLSKLEDYEFLLRFCSQYISSFRLIGKFVGDYYLKSDGTNTLTGESSLTETAQVDWARSRELVLQLKREQILSARVQRELGVFPPENNLTIMEVMKKFLVPR